MSCLDKALTCSFGVNHSLWDPFPVKVGHFISEDHILNQKRTSGTSSLQVQLVSNGMSSPSGQDVWLLMRDEVKINSYLTSVVFFGKQRFIKVSFCDCDQKKNTEEII